MFGRITVIELKLSALLRKVWPTNWVTVSPFLENRLCNRSYVLGLCLIFTCSRGRLNVFDIQQPLGLGAICVSALANLQSTLYPGLCNVFPFLFKHQLLESCDLCLLWEVSCMLVAKMNLKAWPQRNQITKMPNFLSGEKKKKDNLDFF